MTRQRPETPSPDIALPITPMLDMTFQLLTFFIFTYHPAALEASIDFALPSSRGATVGDVLPDPSAAELEVVAPVTVVARAAPAGEALGSLSALSVRTLGGETTVPGPDALRTFLDGLRRKAPQTGEIKVQADATLKYALVVAVMDACRQSGFAQISLAPPEDPAALGP